VQNHDGEKGAVRGRADAQKRRSAKAQKGGVSPKGDEPWERRYVMLRKSTIQRWGVHTSMTGENESRFVDRVLNRWLRDHGKGRELFESAPGPDSTQDLSVPDTLEDRQDGMVA
jgi:hypothetical protein